MGDGWAGKKERKASYCWEAYINFLLKNDFHFPTTLHHKQTINLTSQFTSLHFNSHTTLNANPEKPTHGTSPVIRNSFKQQMLTIKMS